MSLVPKYMNEICSSEVVLRRAERPLHLGGVSERVREWERERAVTSIHGNMTWDLLLLCKGFGPVGTMRSDSKCADVDLRGMPDLAGGGWSLARVRGGRSASGFGLVAALRVVFLFALQTTRLCCSPQGDRTSRWINFRVRRCLWLPPRSMVRLHTPSVKYSTSLACGRRAMD